MGPALAQQSDGAPGGLLVGEADRHPAGIRGRPAVALSLPLRDQLALLRRGGGMSRIAGGVQVRARADRQEACGAEQHPRRADPSQEVTSRTSSSPTFAPIHPI